MLTDRYDLPVSTTSSAAWDGCVEGCEAKLTIDAFDRAIAAGRSREAISLPSGRCGAHLRSLTTRAGSSARGVAVNRPCSEAQPLILEPVQYF